MPELVSLHYLIFLNLSHCEISKTGNTSFLNLRQLDLSHNNIRTIPLSFTSLLPNLKILNLNWNPLTRIINLAPLQSVNEITQLYIQGLSLSSEEFEAYVQINNTALTYLDASSINFDYIPAFSK